MPLLFQKIVRNDDLRRNPQVLYVFGDNVRRKGSAGQAREMRHEPNAVGIRTKYAPNITFAEGEAETAAQKRMIDEDMKALFAAVKEGRIVVWPADGIGTGLASLHIHAPTTFEYLRSKLAALIIAAKHA